MSELNRPRDPARILQVAFAGHPHADKIIEKMSSAKTAGEFSSAIAATPAMQKLKELVVAYAEKKGDIALECLRLVYGPFWGTAITLTPEQCARVLGVSEADVKKVLTEESRETYPLLHASSEYRAWQAARAIL